MTSNKLLFGTIVAVALIGLSLAVALNYSDDTNTGDNNIADVADVKYAFATDDVNNAIATEEVVDVQNSLEDTMKSLEEAKEMTKALNNGNSGMTKSGSSSDYAVEHKEVLQTDKSDASKSLDKIKEKIKS